MSKSPSAPPRLSRVLLAVLFAFGATGCAHVNARDVTPGVSSSVVLPPQAKGKPAAWSGRAFRQGVVAVANPYGAEAGAAILEQGGNAIDAAVAIAYALNVVEPQSAGIGGGGFMMIHLAKTGETITIDTREKAPAGAKPDMFVGMPNFAVQSLQESPSACPGMVRGTELALEKYGRLSLAQVLQPAIKLADDGFAATPRFVSSPNCGHECGDDHSRAKNSPFSAEYFCPGGQAIAPGTVVTNKPLADTFRLIARHGADCFYKVDASKGLRHRAQASSRARPGRARRGRAARAGSMTLADLEAYQPAIRAPIEGTYRGYRIKSMAPPSSGALTVIQILKMLERFPLGDAGQGYGFGSVNTLNVMADAMRIAFADRANWMGDKDFVRSDERADQLQLPRDARRRDRPGVPDPAQPGARRPAAVRDRGNRAGHGRCLEGARQHGERHDALLRGGQVGQRRLVHQHDRVGLRHRRVRRVQARRRFLQQPRLPAQQRADRLQHHADAQRHHAGAGLQRRAAEQAAAQQHGAVDDVHAGGQPFLAYGSPGGATIINSVVNVTLNLIDHKMTLQQAIDAGRISVSSAGSGVTLETNRLPASAASGLVALGYTVSSGDVGSVQAVLIDQQTGKQYGGADDRREGKVIGLPQSF
jgi:gamma-glutamyltranspeptidase / glutathione hydrolase